MKIDWKRLIDNYLDESIRPDEMHELKELIKKDKKVLYYYVERMKLQSSLSWNLGERTHTVPDLSKKKYRCNMQPLHFYYSTPILLLIISLGIYMSGSFRASENSKDYLVEHRVQIPYYLGKIFHCFRCDGSS